MAWRFIFILLLLAIPPMLYYLKFNDFGTITFDVFGHSIRSNSAGLFVLFTGFYLVLHTILWVINLPARMARRYKAHNMEKGIKSLMETFTASIVDDQDMLRSAIDDLRRYWGRNPVQKYYLARLAQASQNDLDYQRHVADLINDPQGIVLGNFLRAEELLRQNNLDAAYQTLKQMLDDSPYSAWVLQHLFECACQLSKFAEAENYLEMMYRFQLFTKERINHFESHMLTLKAADLDKPDALKLYMKAVFLNPRNYHAVIQAATLAQTLNKKAKCREIVEQAWVTKPSFKEAEELANIYASSFQLHSEVEKLDYLQKLKELVPEYEEQFRVEAHFAIKARLWGRARKAISHLDSDMRAEDYMLLAEIEAGEGQAKQQVENLEKALGLMLQERDQVCNNEAHGRSGA